MKRIIILLWLVLATTCLAQEGLIPPPGGGTKVYLPGDLVHLVVGAPADVVEVSAITPNGQKLQLTFERRTHTWHGYWEVPYGFKKGTYGVSLTALDVEGKTFMGETSAFYIGEPALVTLVGLDGGQTFRTRETQVVYNLASQARIPVAEAKSEVQLIRTIVQEILKATRGSGAPPPAAAATASPAGPAQPQDRDLELEKVRRLIGTRSNLLIKEYERAKNELEALVELEPENEKYRRMLERLNDVIYVRGKEQ